MPSFMRTMIWASQKIGEQLSLILQNSLPVGHLLARGGHVPILVNEMHMEDNRERTVSEVCLVPDKMRHTHLDCPISLYPFHYSRKRWCLQGIQKLQSWGQMSMHFISDEPEMKSLNHWNVWAVGLSSILLYHQTHFHTQKIIPLCFKSLCFPITCI